MQEPLLEILDRLEREIKDLKSRLDNQKQITCTNINDEHIAIVAKATIDKDHINAQYNRNK